ncbi:glycosaminoglycan xylosylkinase homolog isoform X2 [Plodia interpunctella]|uniref:glycosaminoglycan xylosylkinase homolog isoform X2 n=1 Tax=Plodia interpunctella TaxID=58824 RepID=UPI002367C015|nr:glycosaminoglycan xylosylkinase homolog isoform X2 [Plodia interpunctella]
MSMNYAFGFSLILLILVALNIYFFYTLNTVGKRGPVYLYEPDLKPNVYREIYEYLNYLPDQYKSRNIKFIPIQKQLIQTFNSSSPHNTKDVWQYADNWISEESLFPQYNGTLGKILYNMRTAKISRVEIAPKGSQLKLSLILEGKYKMYFKPKRYELTHIVTGDIYGGYDRHNSEVFAYYLAMVMNFKWIAPCVIRKLHVANDVVPVATKELRLTMIKNGTSRCIYGKCRYCHFSKTVCPDKNGEIEGATILLLNKKFQTHVSPWRRSYNSKKMSWETENNFCVMTYSTWRHLEMLSGGILTETIKILSSFQGFKLATEDHYKAVERRLLKIYATVQYCIGKHGSAKVFKIS